LAEEVMKLSEMVPGSTAVLRELPVGGAFLRLREMGLLPGTRVRLIRRAPLGDPIEIEVRGYHLSLRREEADQIVIDPARQGCAGGP
jgi:ferrous iron transport protein A